MRFATVCSGIEAASLAWQPLGWEAVFYSEIAPFAAAVLHHHYGSGRPMLMPSPDEAGLGWREQRQRRNAIKAVSKLPFAAPGAPPNFGDLARHKDWPDATIDLLAGGTPCQSFSVAGLRAGLDDPRGNLTLTYLAAVAQYRPRWVVWENVPGVLSIDDGRAFGALLGGLGQLGYGWAYRVLDAQFTRASGLPFAVPQRRRRVFVVGYLGDWRRAAAVLFDGASLRGDSPPRREAGQTVAGTLGASIARRGGVDEGERGNLIPDVAHALRAEGFDASEDGTGRGTPLIPVGGGPAGGTVSGAVSSKWAKGSGGPAGDELYNMVAVPFGTTQITHPVNESNPQPGDPAGALAKTGHPPVIAFHGSQDPDVSGDVAHPLGRNQGQETAIAFNHLMGAKAEGIGASTDTSITLGVKTGGGAVTAGWRVRRLMPVECERLMGMPDGYTAIIYNGKPAADGPRYMVLGNSWPVNVARVIGERIDMIDKI